MDATTLPIPTIPDINGLFASGKINEACKGKLIAIAGKLQSNPTSITADEMTLLQQVMNGNVTTCNDEGFSLSSIPIWGWGLLILLVGYTVMSD